MNIPQRQIRAVYTDSTIRVYQAYSHRIAESALKAGTFVSPPFKMERMTWIKPSFLWMMYRSGWGQKEGQERILAIDITREGFDWALKNSCQSHFDKNIHPNKEEWVRQLKNAPVRIQWDPERDILLEKLDYRSIQIGLTGEAVDHYVNEWIQRILDVTDLATKINKMALSGDLNTASAMLPKETKYLLSLP